MSVAGNPASRTNARYAWLGARAPLSVGRPHRVAEGREQRLGLANRVRRGRCRWRRRGLGGGRRCRRGRRGSGCRRYRFTCVSGIGGAARLACLACLRAPRGGAFLSRRDLPRRHLRGQRVALGQRRDLAPACGDVEPLVTLHVVLEHAETLNVQSPERQHRSPLARGRTRPPLGQRLVGSPRVPRPLPCLEIGPGRLRCKERRRQKCRPERCPNHASFPPRGRVKPSHRSAHLVHRNWVGEQEMRREGENEACRRCPTWRLSTGRGGHECGARSAPLPAQGLSTRRAGPSRRSRKWSRSGSEAEMPATQSTRCTGEIEPGYGRNFKAATMAMMPAP